MYKYFNEQTLVITNPYKNLLPLTREHVYQYVRKGKKIMRNDKCHCGSGKKFKSCCINKF